jgi:hypothetical protein
VTAIVSFSQVNELASGSKAVVVDLWVFYFRITMVFSLQVIGLLKDSEIIFISLTAGVVSKVVFFEIQILGNS